jgi:hypothetical protein
LPFASYGLFKKSIIDSYGFYNLISRLLQTRTGSCATCINTESRWYIWVPTSSKCRWGAWAPLQTKPLRYYKRHKDLQTAWFSHF